jgi:hypothetical protein
LAGFCPDTLKPLSPNQLARRAAIKRMMAAVAKASEADLPECQRRQVIDLRAMGREGLAAVRDMGVAILVAAPLTFIYFISLLP